MTEYSPKSMLVSAANLVPKRATALAVLVGVGLAACGGGGDSTISSHNKSGHKAGSSLEPILPRIRVKYFSDGVRELVMSSINASGDLGGDDGDYDGDTIELTDIFEFCDGRDLVEESIGIDGGDYGTSTGLSRSVDYPACVKFGRLTPSDMPLSPAEIR